MVIFLIFFQESFFDFQQLFFQTLAKKFIQKAFVLPNLKSLDFCLKASLHKRCLLLIKFISFGLRKDVHFFDKPTVVISRFILQNLFRKFIHFLCEISVSDGFKQNRHCCEVCVTS